VPRVSVAGFRNLESQPADRVSINILRFQGLAPVRLDLQSGSRTLWRELMPDDPAGIAGVYSLALTPDGRSYAYTYARYLDSLYLVTGLE